MLREQTGKECKNEFIRNERFKLTILMLKSERTIIELSNIEWKEDNQ
jgi:hypothetical protein